MMRLISCLYQYTKIKYITIMADTWISGIELQVIDDHQRIAKIDIPPMLLKLL